ncbi:Uncharacterised protein [Neisseria meningitidis]|nr:Uncharacterised protein [Neisseria meningitidis]
MDVAQHVHQIADIETDFEFAALIGDFDFFARFFLLVVAAHNAQQAGLQKQSRTAEFFIGKNRCTFQRAQQFCPRQHENLVVVQRNHAVEIGEFAVDDLADDGRAVALETHLFVQQLDLNRIVGVVQQFEQFQHRFARQNHFGARQIRINRAGCIGKAVSVGRHKAQLAALNLHQQTVEIIADVLHRHAVLHLRQHGFETLLLQRESRADVLADIHHRKIGGRQGLQGKTRFARLQRQTAVVPIQRHQRTGRQRAQNILKFLGIGGDAEVARAALGTRSVDLDFQIGCQEFGLTAFSLNQDVGQDGQGVAAFDDAGNGLQRLEQAVALGL